MVQINSNNIEFKLSNHIFDDSRHLQVKIYSKNDNMISVRLAQHDQSHLKVLQEEEHISVGEEKSSNSFFCDWSDCVGECGAVQADPTPQ